jgi:eukaryotic translation initiation factor 2C
VVSLFVFSCVSEPGKSGPSLLAAVASVDGSACQYVSCIEPQPHRVEIDDMSLVEPAYKLIGSFMERNREKMPERIIVFRDGVSDSQFEHVLCKELEAIVTAADIHLTRINTGKPLEQRTFRPKIAYIVCQKNHHTKLTCEVQDPRTGSVSYTNLCPGVCVDASSSTDGITSAIHNEFYLNAHIALQGTAKATKYIMLYDDIGMKLPELELLTYWTSYLYGRCNKPVSMATPATYAHLAAKRARHLLAAGGSEDDLKSISQLWLQKEFSSMYFI